MFFLVYFRKKGANDEWQLGINLQGQPQIVNDMARANLEAIARNPNYAWEVKFEEYKTGL